LYDEKKLGDWFPKKRVRVSYLQNSLTARLSLGIVGSLNHHLFLNRFPRAAEAWDFSEFDLVISTSSAFAHGIITNGRPKHLCYVNAPARYLWDRTHDVMNEASKGILGPLKKQHLEATFHKLRMWNTEAADRPDLLLAASKSVQRRIEQYWRRKSTVLYPPIDDSWFKTQHTKSEVGKYFLIVSSLVRYKRIELAIEACNKLKLPLKIAGTGSDMNRLKSLAGPTIEFLGFTTEENLKTLYANAIATLFPGDEDFGLVPIESMACGTPVIAFRGGGALETMNEGHTGEFFDEPTVDSLLLVMQKFDQKKY
jgi:glycosyltransferase involved in cell wall biosynthesis